MIVPIGFMLQCPNPRMARRGFPVFLGYFGCKGPGCKKESKKLETVLENENGGPEVDSASLKKQYILANKKWKEDIIPEIMDGHNAIDFVDPNIMQRLEELER
eukprot:Gb_00430 [translate_table: standard]